MIKGFLHAQSEFSFHNASNNALCQVFAARELINLGNHLAIRRPFVFQSLGFIIVDSGLLYCFLHNRTIKRFPRIFFPFA